MEKKYWIALLVLAVVAIGGYMLFGRQSTPASVTPQQTPQATRIPATTEEVSTPASTPGATTETGEETVELTMTAGNLFFRPGTLTLEKGKPVRITVSNTGVHTFTIDELGVDKTLSEQTEIIEFTPETTGTFTYYCAVPGHREGGMLGTLTVIE